MIQIGHMNPGRWRHIAKTYQKLGFITGELSFEDFLYDPTPGKDFPWLKRMAALAVGICILFTAATLILSIFNRGLTKEVKERTRAEKELRDRKNLLNEMGSLARIGGWEHDLLDGAGQVDKRDI